MTRWAWLAAAVGVVLSIVVSYRMAHLTLVLGSESGRWVYGYLWSFHWRALATAMATFAICGAPLLLPAHVLRRREWWVVVFLLVAGTAMQLKLRTLTPYSMGRMFESDGSNGYYGETRRHPASVLLRNFDRLRPTLTIHPRSNMPGKLVLVYALERVSYDPGTLATLVVILSNLGGVLLYLFVRDFTGDAVTAAVSLALYLFVPGKLFFFPILNTVTPVIVIGCLYLWHRVILTGALSYGVALGVGLFALAAFEPLPFVTGLLFAAIGVNAVHREQTSWQRLAIHAAIAALAFSAVALVMSVWLTFNLPVVFRHLMNDAVEFNALARRPYRIWIWRNLVDFAIAAGLVQVLLLPCVAAGSRRHPMSAFALGLGCAILVTDVLGGKRGEVIRLWIFFGCLLQVPAAYACTRLLNRGAALAALAASLAVGAVGTSMIAFGQP